MNVLKLTDKQREFLHSKILKESQKFKNQRVEHLISRN